jgi:hypothetical protein
MAAPLSPRAEAVLSVWSLAGSRPQAEEALRLDTAASMRSLVQSTLAS